MSFDIVCLIEIDELINVNHIVLESFANHVCMDPFVKRVHGLDVIVYHRLFLCFGRTN